MLAFSNQPNNRAVNSKTILVTNQGVYNHDNTLQISLRNASLQYQTASEQLKITKRIGAGSEKRRSLLREEKCLDKNNKQEYYALSHSLTKKT